jgi:xanthine dehydrogenase FAD-binding subunit
MTKVMLPETLDELWPILENEPETAIYAGGTDFLVKRRKGLCGHGPLACLERIGELRGIEEDARHVNIGACATFPKSLPAPPGGSLSPSIKALSILGSPHIRNMGTIGGNIATASPAGDSLAPLYVLGAEIKLVTSESFRLVPVKDLIKGPGQTDIRPKEIISGVVLKKSGAYNLHHYEKIGRRKALSIAIVSLAALMKIDENSIIKEAHFAWGSVAPTVFYSPEAEKAVKGRPLNMQVLGDAADIIRRDVQPIDDIRASAGYRRSAAANILFRLLQASSDFSHGSHDIEVSGK